MKIENTTPKTGTINTDEEQKEKAPADAVATKALNQEKTKDSKHCFACDKKLNFTQQQRACRCGEVFCRMHNNVGHKCPFDYKRHKVQQLEQQRKKVCFTGGHPEITGNEAY